MVAPEAVDELRQFVRKLGYPITQTLMGLGAFPASDPLWLGMLGMHGTYRANMSTANCDLLIGIGVRFDDRVTGKISTFASKAKIVHIDIDPTSISKNIPVHTPIVGDCKTTLEKLNKLLEAEDLKGLKAARKPWFDNIIDWKSTNPLAYEQGDIIKPQFVVEKLFEVTKGDAIITTEVGQNQMWSAQYFHFDKPNTFITSGGLGVMGFGLPAAIGAQVARPDATVIDIAGDGSIQMNMQEMATAMQFGLPVKVAILNNGYLGMVRQWQELFFDRRYASTLLENPDFQTISKGYHIESAIVNERYELDAAVKKMVEHDGPFLLEVKVEKEGNVFPMVPTGASVSDIRLE